MKYYVKVYMVQSEVLVAACDECVYGKCYREGEVVLKGERKFFGDELMEEEELEDLLKRATIANLLGENIVAYGIRLGIIDADNVITVEGVPHAQMVRM